LKIHRPHGVFVLFATLLLAVTSWLGTRTLAQGDDLNAPSPALTAGDVIAQGVSPAPSGEVAWRLVRNTAEPLGEAEAGERPLGFVVATDDAILITDETTGSRLRIAPGEAAFSARGVIDRRESLGAGETPYLRFALVPVEAAQETSGGELLLAGEGFAAPEGEHDYDLVSLRLDPGQAEQVTSAFPMLVYVLDGEIETAGDGGDQSSTVGAGEASVVDGGASISSDEGAHVLVAVIGPSVPTSEGAVAPTTVPGTPAAEAETGQIVVFSELCPVGVTAEQAQDTSAGDPCFGGEPVEGLLVTAVDEQGESYQDEVGANGQAILTELPPGTYLLTLEAPEGLGETVGVCGGQDRSSDLPVVTMVGSSAELDLPAGKEYDCVTRTLQLEDEEPVGGTPVN
jgi:hypothetical protein